MPKFINLVGKRFGRLIVIEKAENNRWGQIQWLCLCDCGQEAVVRGCYLVSNHTKSCGCLQKEARVQSSVKHGHYKNRKQSKTYKAWSGIIQRCNNPRNGRYHRYGKRGITVCKRWVEFKNFLEDMGKKPTDKHSIDRVNNNGNYCKSNCKWSLPKEQARNRKTNRMITYKGKTQCLVAWAEEIGIHHQTLLNRIVKLNWPIEKALTTPIRQRSKKK